MIDLDTIYENLDKMQEMKRYKPPTRGYFPSVAEINTYARSKDFEYMLPYLLWLDESLTDNEDRKTHREAIATLRNIVTEMEEDEEVYGGDYSETTEDDEIAKVDEECEEKVEREIIYLDMYEEDN